MYQHLDNLAIPVDLPVGKVVCVGRNYQDHIDEMGSQAAPQAVLFMKPSASLTPLNQPVSIPADRGACHNEVELAILIKQRLCKADQDDVRQAVWGVGLGLDLTLRDVQQQLKADGQPWERAKAFDGSCPMSGFVPLSQVDDIQNMHFGLKVNGSTRQQGHSAAMMRPVFQLLAEISQVFTLEPGDIVLTGTPKGVGPLAHNDKLEVYLDEFFAIETSVVTI